MDCNGRTTHDEEKTKQSCHLCHALASCSNLRDLSLSAYRCCSDLFTMSNWPHLRNLKIDMMFYTGCNDEEDDSELREALVLACVGGRLPSLRKPNIIFQTSENSHLERPMNVCIDNRLTSICRHPWFDL